MISVAEALAHVLALGTRAPSETVPLTNALDRVLAHDLHARRTQPPFAASAMDGYAIRDADWRVGACLDVIGEAAAGHAFDGTVGAGQAARIFTGAPLPQGADRVVIQEDVTRSSSKILLNAGLDQKTYVRPAGGDFREGDVFPHPKRLAPADLALLASMNHAFLPVVRKPIVAIIATGDELVAPGEIPRFDQIIASNSTGIAAQIKRAGGAPRLLPIARDTRSALREVFALAQGADLIVTIGGASVGDHDLVGKVAAELGMEQAFYKVAMRPGKPLMAGRMGRAAMIGLPGNPVSSMVCTEVFIVPLIHKMLGLDEAGPTPQPRPLAHDLPANGPRTHYMRATVAKNGTVQVAESQDSALMGILATSNALVVRPIGDPARKSGDLVDVLPL